MTPPHPKEPREMGMVDRYRFPFERLPWTARDQGEEHRDMLEQLRKLWAYLDGIGAWRGDDADNTLADEIIAHIEGCHSELDTALSHLTGEGK